MRNIYIELKITEEIIKKLEAVDSNWMKSEWLEESIKYLSSLFEKHGE